MNDLLDEIVVELGVRAVFCDSDVEADCLVQIIKAIRAWQGESA